MMHEKLDDTTPLDRILEIDQQISAHQEDAKALAQMNLNGTTADSGPSPEESIQALIVEKEALEKDLPSKELILAQLSAQRTNLPTGTDSAELDGLIHIVENKEILSTDIRKIIENVRSY